MELAHLSDSSHGRSLSSPNSFKVLDQASTEYELKIKEATYIQSEKPFPNKQLKQAISVIIISLVTITVLIL